MKTIGKSLVVVAVLMLATTLIFTDCKGPQKCKGVVTVYDSAGVIPQANVNVKFYAEVTNPSGGTSVADLKYEGNTDSQGRIEITLDLPAILDIDAQKLSGCVTSTCKGVGIIKLEEGKTTDKKVNLEIP